MFIRQKIKDFSIELSLHKFSSLILLFSSATEHTSNQFLHHHILSSLHPAPEKKKIYIIWIG